MKKLVWTVLLAGAMTVFANASRAEQTTIVYPKVISAAITSPQFGPAVTALIKQASLSGKTIFLKASSYLNIGTETYAYFAFDELVNVVGNKTQPYGELVGVMAKGSNNTWSVQSFYFKPAPELPGGATVRN